MLVGINKAKELMKSAGLVVEPEKPVQDALDNYIKMADKAILAGNFSEAAKIYEEAARVIPKEAERMLSEAIELRKKGRDIVITQKEIHRKAGGKQDYEDTLQKIKEALEKKQYQELVKLYMI